VLLMPKRTRRTTTSRTPRAATRRRAPRTKPDFDGIIAIAIELISVHGEAGLRIDELVRRTGASTSSIYAHFGDRDGIVAAALSRMYESWVVESIAGIRAIVDQSHTTNELREALRAATAFTQDLARTGTRLDRAGVVAGTRGRPAYSKALTGVQTRLNDELAEVIALAARRGLAAPRYPVRTIATFLQAYTFGRVLAHFDGKRPRDEQQRWNALVTDVVEMMLFGDPRRGASGT